jgi:hypothetical protein
MLTLVVIGYVEPMSNMALAVPVVQSMVGGNNPLFISARYGVMALLAERYGLLVVAVASLWHGGYWLSMNNGGGPRVYLVPRQRSASYLLLLIWPEC